MMNNSSKQLYFIYLIATQQQRRVKRVVTFTVFIITLRCFGGFQGYPFKLQGDTRSHFMLS